MDVLYQVDVSVFRAINDATGNPMLDTLFIYLTKFNQSWGIAAVAIMYLFARRKMEGFTILFFCILSITLADQTASHFFKPMIERTRPCFELEHVHLLINQPRSYSFASSHAANTAAVATTLFFFFFRTSKWDKGFVIAMSIYTILVGYSRVYVGVHYPSDVLGGFLIGIVSAVLVYGGLSYFWKNVVEPRRLRGNTSQ